MINNGHIEKDIRKGLVRDLTRFEESSIWVGSATSEENWEAEQNESKQVLGQKESNEWNSSGVLALIEWGGPRRHGRACGR